MGLRTPIGEPEARALYIGMGIARSLNSLQVHLAQEGRAISVKTLGVWSSKHGWVEAALQADNRATTRATAVYVKNAARRVASRSEQFDTLATESLAAALEGLKHIDMEKLRASDIKALSEVSVNAAKMVELLEGRATERPEDMTKTALDNKLNAMTAELTERLEGVPSIH